MKSKDHEAIGCKHDLDLLIISHTNCMSQILMRVGAREKYPKSTCLPYPTVPTLRTTK